MCVCVVSVHNADSQICSSEPAYFFQSVMASQETLPAPYKSPLWLRSSLVSWGAAAVGRYTPVPVLDRERLAPTTGSLRRHPSLAPQRSCFTKTQMTSSTGWKPVMSPGRSAVSRTEGCHYASRPHGCCTDSCRSSSRHTSHHSWSHSDCHCG